MVLFTRLQDLAAGLKPTARAGLVQLVARIQHMRHRIAYRKDIVLVRTWQWLGAHRRTVFWLVAGMFVISSLFAVTPLQRHLGAYFADAEHLKLLSDVLLTVGGALLGAAAIAFSVLIFSMQVNIERMPHALFHRFSTDPMLLLQFAGVMTVSVVIAASSIVVNQAYAALTSVAAAWGVLTVAALLWFGYLRAVHLIDPRVQLAMVAKSAQKEFAWWDKRARTAAPLMKTPPPEQVNTTHDWARFAYFSINSIWTSGLSQHMRHVTAYHRSFAVSGDYEISAYALRCLLGLLAGYVKTKGKTFFHHPGLVDNPRATDAVINEALEHLRKNVRIAVSRADEQQIEQNLQSLGHVSAMLLEIDYSADLSEKTHAHLAIGYLESAVESITPHQMPDVVMEGLRLLGRVAAKAIVHSPDRTVSTVQKIAKLGCVGASREDHRPITLEAMRQLAKLTLRLLLLDGHVDVHFATDEARRSVALLSKVFISLVKDAALPSTHSSYLAPYFSSTSSESLLLMLVACVNEATGDNAQQAQVERFCAHLEDWAQDEPQVATELLLFAIEKRSSFTFDIVHWIGQMVEILIAASTARHCREHDRQGLRRAAVHLLWTLSWVPDEDEPMRYISTYKLDDVLFEAGRQALRHGIPEVVAAAREGLISFAMKSGRHQDPMRQMDSALRGAMILAQSEGLGAEAATFAMLTARLADARAPSIEKRQALVDQLNEHIDELGRRRHGFDRIDQAMAAQPRDEMRALLERLVAAVVPGQPPWPI